MQHYPELRSKLPYTGTTIFAVMSKLAAEHGAINLSQGFPDFACSDILIELVNKYMHSGWNQYAPMTGVPVLRQRLSEKIEFLYNRKTNPDTEINITAGATQAIYTAITAFISEGDQVIIFEPAYDCYVPAIELNKGIPVYVRLTGPGFEIPWEEVRDKINDKTRMIIINTPHNPTGTILKKSDIETLSEIVEGTNILVLSDEVYEHIIFDGGTHESILKYPSLKQRSLAVFSFGKVFHVTGWKLGYCVAEEHLMAEFRKVHQYIVYTCNTPVQFALAEFLQYKDEYLLLGDFFQKKRDHFIGLLNHAGFKVHPSEGTYFQLLDYSDFSKSSDIEFAKQLTIETGVASIPISVFYHDKFDDHILRFCFAKSESILEQGVSRLAKIIEKIPG